MSAEQGRSTFPYPESAESDVIGGSESWSWASVTLWSPADVTREHLLYFIVSRFTPPVRPTLLWSRSRWETPMLGLRSTAAAMLVMSVTVGACDGAGAGSEGRTPSLSGPPAVVQQDGTKLNGTLLDPPLPRPRQRLPDTRGLPFSLADRPEGELTVVFFGYTHCPDVCPTTMADLAGARRRMPSELRARLTVVFVTEDPQRDTPSSLRRWLDGFDSSFVGLIGGSSASRSMLKELYLPETSTNPRPRESIRHPEGDGSHQPHGDYGVDHPGVVYAFGPGHTTVIYTTGAQSSQYATDFSRLLKTARPA